MRILHCLLLFIMSMNGFAMFSQNPLVKFPKGDSIQSQILYRKIETSLRIHSLRRALYTESNLYYYLKNPMIVLLGGVSSGKSTLINNILQSLGSNRQFVCEIPNGLAMANFIDFCIQQDPFFVSTFPENMCDFFRCLDSEDFFVRTRKKLTEKFPIEKANALLNNYRNEDFYYAKLAELILNNGVREAIVTTHTHSYDSFLKLKRALTSHFIRMPLYAFYYFVPLEELISRTKIRNFHVIQKVSPFYDIRFSWDIFYDFFKNLSVNDAYHTDNIITCINKFDILMLLDNLDKRYLSYLLDQIFRVFGVKHKENFQKKRAKLRRDISEIFSNHNKINLFFKGDRSIVVGQYDFVANSIKVILEHFIEKVSILGGMYK